MTLADSPWLTGCGSDWVCSCIQVLEEREKLKQEREIRMTKKEYLIKELERLRKQQGRPV